MTLFGSRGGAAGTTPARSLARTVCKPAGAAASKEFVSAGRGTRSVGSAHHGAWWLAGGQSPPYKEPIMARSLWVLIAAAGKPLLLARTLRALAACAKP